MADVFKSMIDRVKSSLTDSEKKDLDNFLNKWGSTHPFGQIIVKNLDIEHFLDIKNFSELVRFILFKKNDSIEDFQDEYDEKCYEYKLKGGNVKWKGKKPKYIGTAVDKLVFVEYLTRKYNNIFMNNKDIYNFIEELKQGILSRNKKTINLKEFNIWATWNENNLNPFSFCKTEEADEIRANLGLPKTLKNIENNEILLFIYPISEDINIKRPTIADAGLNQYFKPPSLSFSNHGLTCPLKDEEKFKGYNMESRPEGIHKTINLSKIILPLKFKN